MTCRSCFDPMSYEDVDHIVKSSLKFKDLIGDEKLSFNDVFMDPYKTKSNSGGSLTESAHCAAMTVTQTKFFQTRYIFALYTVASVTLFEPALYFMNTFTRGGDPALL